MTEKKGQAVVQIEEGDKPVERKTVECIELPPEEMDKRIIEKFSKKE